jgi:hypothetical protein
VHHDTAEFKLKAVKLSELTGGQFTALANIAMEPTRRPLSAIMRQRRSAHRVRYVADGRDLCGLKR